ncbi:hypothetical protein Ptr902_13002 [Pyrenophora tritici-repentis]|nr:hypothetical protein Ptr902_13002 [Pyrenophora tritici-repentis]
MKVSVTLLVTAFALCVQAAKPSIQKVHIGTKQCCFSDFGEYNACLILINDNYRVLPGWFRGTNSVCGQRCARMRGGYQFAIQGGANPLECACSVLNPQNAVC